MTKYTNGVIRDKDRQYYDQKINGVIRGLELKRDRQYHDQKIK